MPRARKTVEGLSDEAKRRMDQTARKEPWTGPSRQTQRKADSIITKYGDGDMDYREMMELLTINGIDQKDADHIVRNMGREPSPRYGRP